MQTIKSCWFVFFILLQSLPKISVKPIHNGEDALRDDQNQHLISIRHGDNTHKCGATILQLEGTLKTRLQFAFTAAHCLCPKGKFDPNNIGHNVVIAQVGSEMTSSSIVRKILDGQCFPGWADSNGDENRDVDLVVFSFEHYDAPSRHVPNIDLGCPLNELKPDTACRIAGWGYIGRDGKGNGIPSKTLQTTTLVLTNAAQCDKKTPTLPLRGHPLICAKSVKAPKLSYLDKGDSGSPLICKTGTPTGRHRECVAGVTSLHDRPEGNQKIMIVNGFVNLAISNHLPWMKEVAKTLKVK